MSQAGDESSSSDDTELEVEKEQPICALAPTVYTRDEGSTDVSSSPAFQCLDELFSAGKLTGSRVAELKAKYTLLHETVISLQESEIQLLQEVRRLSVDLEQQQHELEKAEQFPEGSSSEVCRIQQQLLHCQNEYNAIKEREHEIQLRIKCLQEEKRLLEKEYERIPKQGEADNKFKKMKDDCDELRKEVIQRKAEVNAMKEDILSKQKLILTDKKEVEKLLEFQESLKDELVKILGVPAQLKKETEKINRKKIDAEKENEDLNNQMQELNSTLKDIDKGTEKILQEREDVMKELDGKRALLESKEQECAALTKLLEIAREKELAILGERDSLNNTLNKRIFEKKEQHEILINKQAEKDKQLRNLKKMELQLNVIYESLEQDKSQHKKLKLEAEAIPKANGVLLERRRELQKEIEKSKRCLAKQEMVSDKDARTLEECIAEEGRLFKEQEKCRNELSRLAHLTGLKVEEKEQKSREVQKVQIQLQNIIKEIKRKDLQIEEYKKRKRRVQKQLQGLANMCDVIQNERNKCIHLVHAAQQKTIEIKDWIKVKASERETLRNTLITQERELQKQHMKNKNNIAINESLKNDCSKVVQVMNEMNEKKKQQVLDLDRLINIVTRVEEEIAQLHKKYKKAIEEQNESGLLLRSREEEICILYEKINAQEFLCRKGDIEMQAMDEEISFLKMKVAEKERQIKFWFKALPMKRALDAQLVVLQIQYSQCKDRIKEMEEIFVDPTNESRKRDLGGKDPSPPELQKKIEQLEVELVQKEEKLLETDVIYEHVSWLTDRIRATAENGKQGTLLLATRINELQKKIKDKTQKMMALVAELSMKQALAIKLQQEMKDKEEFLMIVSSRIDQGLPPPKETEIEWLKVLRNEKMHKEAAEARARQAAEEERAAVPGHVLTTAEPRPTAYIPDDAYSLPVPRPYGALAPFKPSEPGSNMRHFRKPIIKPIEL
ncbi:coiled-coil domain-containing protein 146 isoform X2 [Numida meleagris]|nr:coiled-coil domain-containing protein 146 isoform X2 [Numida meleagris]XP_021240181.1 coiled-coil domain-containing protein 146 isoform X2 [Numida meleagris]XP_021240182.1 coiled-coil domain-containing protein 146 isoform X2 [Numida meleagris]XP_021240183.1 coiled-coil domain-containing protein 146 isoform X2 [Numida meleagris]XP_021240184.1 coiled-coil domain-containing protein 146 isoform X2 [Numida meleagris]XP_021240185.1 coiled-coil domain-containing protein 146 isoform X2 [Numida mele